MSYKNTFIKVSEDCPVTSSEIPKEKGGKKPAHLIQYELLTTKPYTFDHERLIFEVYLQHKELTGISTDEKEALWQQMFSKGHPCMRASALVKRYGFGAHYNEEGKIAIYPVESSAYKEFMENTSVQKQPGMKSKR